MKFLIGIFVIYVLVVAALYFMQRDFIYFPDSGRPDVPEGVEIVDVAPEEGLEIQGWYVPPRDKSKAVILFFHGNAGHYGHRMYKANFYIQAGYGVLLAGYRGYGGNSGVPSEQGFYRDGRAYMAWLKEYAVERKIVLYGESIGSGTAVQMATEFDVHALVLETPFASLVEAASKHYPFVPVRFLLKDRYENVKKIGRVNTPVLILHGNQDAVIGFSSAQKLYEAAIAPKVFVDFPQGNHNDLYMFGAYTHILDFLSGNDVENKQ